MVVENVMNLEDKTDQRKRLFALLAAVHIISEVSGRARMCLVISVTSECMMFGDFYVTQFINRLRGKLLQ